MKKIFDKYETIICIAIIVIYILINSFCLNNFGVYNYMSALINTLFSVVLILLIIFLKKIRYYGITKIKNTKDYLYFIPLVLIVSVNLWNGININNTLIEIIFFIINMFNIGFLEEIIFRGFLFKMLEKDSINNAIYISAITFGIGHIINLFYGAALVPTIMQICYAISIGYLFAIIFYKSKSLIPCIITHSLVNAFSIFNVENGTTSYFISIFLIIVPLIYANYIKNNILNR